MGQGAVQGASALEGALGTASLGAIRPLPSASRTLAGCTCHIFSEDISTNLFYGYLKEITLNLRVVMSQFSSTQNLFHPRGPELSRQRRGKSPLN